MHTILMLAAGLGLLVLCVLAGRALWGEQGISPAALLFLPLWLIGAGVNMYSGVTRAGYSVADETPIFLAVFGIPAGAALLAWWKFR